MGIKIKNSARCPQYRTQEGYLVDGFYEEQDKKYIFEFRGCFWHGCPHCYRGCIRSFELYNGLTPNYLYVKTLNKKNALVSKGYKYTEIWECEFRQTLKDDAVLAAELKNHPLLNRNVLNPRDVFYGGRTGNMVKFVEVGPNQRIEYYDICSLYPSVKKTGIYPVGHPVIYVGDDCKNFLGPNFDISNIHGLIKCVVLPPQDLLHPVLPFKMNSRLMFTLCRKCCENENQNECDHEDENERVLCGTWVILELQKAVEKGYKILKVSEIWI